MRLEQLPRDALLAILAHLSAHDIAQLRQALPRGSPARPVTLDPYVWRRLYQLHFGHLRLAPHLTITESGTLDWRAAFLAALRRRQLIYQRRANAWRPPPSAHPSPAAIRIIVNGNIRRIVSDTADRSAANVTWDTHLRAARFDWTGTEPPLSPPSSPPPSAPPP
ncbi:hypothetical protein BWQ96_02743 [Gracilariopsis chorda]|uniref:F-box domain-containing protein n=1 Tax=Gracilariopsis chorda TaxID=448386 RepID=A0A2V3IZ24_9FLOR|nr:hypothetical protein BWQ96_02743 [Gracilariopsis chorda]|eukprot:PXF47412.1 hypothetical protein BWQ96_02743 [Gracilariopsis chorda]